MPDMSTATPRQLPRAVLRGLIARQALPLVLVGLMIWLLRDSAAGLDVGRVLAATRDIPAWSWGAAALATLVSFVAIGRYDAVIHRLLNTGVTRDMAQRAGIAAIASAQTTGFGLLIGTLARWRMLPQLSLRQSARVTIAVTLSFMAGLAVIGALASLWLGAASPVPRVVALAVLLAALGGAALSLWPPRRLLRAQLPPLRAQAAILGLVALDTAAAALALYALLPAAHIPPAATFYAVFLLAFGAGLLGATPGGVGPFEYVCLTLLAGVPEAGLLAAIAGFRVVYYAVPGTLAAILLIAGARRPTPAAPDPPPALHPAGPDTALDPVLRHAPRAEAQLVRQGELDLLCDEFGAPLALAAAAGQSVIVLGEPLCRRLAPARLLDLAQAAADHRNRTPFLYKCPAPLAAAARRAGWRVLRVSDEALIDPAGHDPGHRDCRRMRRALRKAQAAGLRAAEAGAVLPLAEMTRIAQGWARRRGGARGFSLGRFAPEQLHRQRVFLCYDENRRLVAFATFHVARAELALYQMCHAGAAPPGAMHLLIARAIEAAARQGCPRLSLAAVPRAAPRWLPKAWAARLDAASGAPGLRQFKSSFGPRWAPLYAAAPGRLAFCLGVIDVIDRITRSEARGTAPRERELPS